MRFGVWAAAAALGVASSNSAWAAPSAEDLQTNMNLLWVACAAALVFIMQIGFLLLEAGSVRSKNSVNVAIKNLADFMLSTLVFGAIGFMIMFGASQAGLFGAQGGMAWFHLNQGSNAAWVMMFFVFQAMFCGTAATILSGAVAERMQFGAYLWATLVIAGLVYPVVGHWAWSNLLDAENKGWLAAQGFIDFAGSTVVHLVGGAAALAAILVLGARHGKFDENGKPVRIHGHSPVLATGGAMLLFVGWMGFNGGSTLVAGASIAHILFNTLLAGCAGGVVGLLLGRAIDGLYATDKPINGTLAGLVGITAGCDVATPGGAVAIGALAAAAALVAGWWMEHKTKLDDAIGAVPVHMVGGIVGTLGVPFIAAEGKLAVGVWAQAWVQLQGVMATGVFAFAACWLMFSLINRFGVMRVSHEDELKGLNEAEHGARLGVADLQTALALLNHGSTGLSARVTVARGDENGELADQFNQFMAKLEREKQDADTRELARQAQLDAERSARDAERAKAAAEEQARLEAHAKAQQARADRLNAALSAFQSRMNATVAELESVAGQLGGTALTLNEGVAATSQETALISSASETTVADVGAVAAATEELSATVREIAHQMASVRDVAADATTRGAQGAATIRRLLEQTAAMRQVMDFIQAVATKTNLLALNATIEAARAGEAGSGFKVVADEVKLLARQTAEATEQVTVRIDAIGHVVNEVVASMQAIEQACTEVSSSAIVVASGVEQQGAATTEISARAQTASLATSSISERIRLLTETAAATGSSAEHVRNATSGVAAAAREIRVHLDSLVADLKAA
jgi:ammonium transporter, Amt family